MVSVAKERDIDLIRRGMKLQHLRLIAHIHETHQISAAAEAMNISQPAASRLASELERMTGVVLYTRHSRGIELTEYGKRLAIRAQAVIQGLRDAGREIYELSGGRVGSVSIGSVTGPAIEMVLPALKRMLQSHPKVETLVIVDLSDVLAAQLLSSHLDFYIGRIPADLDPGLFEVTVIDEEPIALIVRKEHPLILKVDITLNDCIPFDWVMQTKEGFLRRGFENYLIMHGISLPKKVVTTPSLLFTLATIMETNSIAPVARSVADFFGTGVGLNGSIESLPVAQDFAVSEYALIKRATGDLSPAAQAFFNSLLGIVRGNLVETGRVGK